MRRKGAPVTEGDLPNRLVYDQVLLMRADLAKTREEVAGYTAESRERFEHGQRKLDDHETRLRELKDAVPDGLKADIAALKAASARSTVFGDVVRFGLTAAGSGTASVLVSYWLLHK